jgi:biofilm protein TabA
MIYGHIADLESCPLLTLHPVWKEAFHALRGIPAEPPLGITRLKGESLFMNVMQYKTLPREQCSFETHRKYVDLQYTISGAEIIEWRRASELELLGGYDSAKDLQFYRLGEASARVHMLPGYFSIFYPSDAHLPKISDEIHGSVYKVVIKVGIDLLDGPMQ